MTQSRRGTRLGDQARPLRYADPRKLEREFVSKSSKRKRREFVLKNVLKRDYTLL